MIFCSFYTATIICFCMLLQSGACERYLITFCCLNILLSALFHHQKVIRRLFSDRILVVGIWEFTAGWSASLNRRNKVLFNLLFSNILCMSWIDHTYGFGQVSENWRVLQIQNGRGVVTQDPGELKRNNNNKKNTITIWCLLFIFCNEKILKITHCQGRWSWLTTGYCDRSL